MAAAPTLLTTGTVNTGSAVTTTGSVTPAADGALLLIVYAYQLGVFADTTTVSGAGLTWTKVKTVTGAAGLEILTLFVGYGGTPALGALTITLSATAVGGRYAVVQQTAQDMSANPAGYSNSNSGTGTTGTVAMAAASVTAGRRMFSFFGHRIAEATTPDSTMLTWTEITDATTTLAALEGQWVDGVDPTASATWATSSSWLAIAMELKAALLSGFRSNALDAIDDKPSYDSWPTPSAGGEGRGSAYVLYGGATQRLLSVMFDSIGANANAVQRSKPKLHGLVN